MASGAVALPPDVVDVPHGLPPDAVDVASPQATSKGFGDYLKEYWDQTQVFHPKESAQALVSSAAHPIDTANSYSQQNNELARRATDAFHRGDYTEAARHALHYLLNGIPGFGARLDSAADKLQQGDIGGGLADTASIATDYIAAPKAGKAALKTATEPGAGARAVQPIKTAANKVVKIAKKPAVLKTAGTVAGAAAGHATGVGPWVGGYLGREAAKAVSDWANAPEAVNVPQAVLDRLGMTQADFDALPLDGKQQVVDLAGQMTSRTATPMPPPPTGPVDTGPSVPKGRTMDDLMREHLAAQRQPPMPPPGPPPPKQLNAGAIVPPAPADTSGVIPGWQPTILPNEKMPPPQAAPAMPPPGSPEPPASLLDQENTGMLHDKLIANRAAKAGRFIDYLGGTQNLPRTQAEWAKVATDMGENVPSPETQAQIEAGLNKRMVAGTEVPKKVETIPAHLQKNPKALKIAQKLAESMTATQ